MRPDRHLGTLNLKVDVPGAVVQIDGRRPASTSGPFELAVGTHALRVTHPAYRDFLRFVDIEFDRPLSIDVALSAYPLAEGEMTEKLRKKVGPKVKRPWWQSWWAITLRRCGGDRGSGGRGGADPARTCSLDSTVTYKVRQSP